MYDYLFYKFYARGSNEEYVLDKDKSIAAYKGYMLSRLMKMFKYKNLPETIPQYMLEYYLMINGSCAIVEHEGKPYAFIGTFGGEPDPYYRPTIYVIANPALKIHKSFDLFKVDGSMSNELCFMRNDVLWMGLNPLMSRYATLLAENVITLRVADIMLRVVALLTAPDDKTKIAAEQYLKNLTDGKLGVIGENRFFEGVKMQSPPSNNGSYLTQFIELQQYYKGSFYNEIGLSASFNMKREAIGESEATLNEDTLTPLIDSMLQVRQEDVSRLNELFGLDVSVEFDSAWMQNIIEDELQMNILENDAGGDENEFEGANSTSTVAGFNSSDGGNSGNTGSSDGEAEGTVKQPDAGSDRSESGSVDSGYDGDDGDNDGDDRVNNLSTVDPTIAVTNIITVSDDAAVTVDSDIESSRESKSDDIDGESNDGNIKSDVNSSESDVDDCESDVDECESDDDDCESDDDDDK